MAMDGVSRWVGPVSGVLSVAAIFGGVAVVGEFTFEPSDSAAAVLAEYAAKADNILGAGLLTMLGIGFLLIFLGHLRTMLREGGAAWAADVFLAGGIALAAAWIVFQGIQLAGGVAGESGHAEVAQGVNDFLWNGTLFFAPGLLAVGLAAALASFVYRALPVWLGIFAIVVALGAFAPWLGIFIFVLWVLATSITEIIWALRPASKADVM